MHTDAHQRTAALEFLTVAEVATATKLCQRTIRRHIAAGAIPARRAGGRILVSRADLEVWWTSLEPAGGAGEPLTTTSTSTPTTDYRWTA